MASKRISEKMENALNDQMTIEAFQAQVYLSYASWAEVSGYPGIAEFLYKHMNEERKHMFKFLKYINNRGGEAEIQAIDAPPPNPKGVKTTPTSTSWTKIFHLNWSVRVSKRCPRASKNVTQQRPICPMLYNESFNTVELIVTRKAVVAPAKLRILHRR